MVDKVEFIELVKGAYGVLVNGKWMLNGRTGMRVVAQGAAEQIHITEALMEGKIKEIRT